MVKDLENYLEDQKNDIRIMPTTAPIKDPAFLSLLEKYNNLQLDRQKMLITSTENNPAIQTLDLQAAQLREDLLRLLKSYEQGLIVSRNDLCRQTGNLSSDIQKVPTQEKCILICPSAKCITVIIYLFASNKRTDCSF